MILLFYCITLLFLTVYSYSQIDLNLTLSSNQFYQLFQQQLIYLGYFNRPLSTAIFLVLIFFLFIFYFFILYLVKQNKISFNKILFLIISTCSVLLFSYPAFSHDLFNYMFDARIVTNYHLNPYAYTALDFPGDLWTRFMHWTHRKYPYGPIWLILTIPFSYLGFGKFVLTLFNFKLMFVLFHLGNIFFIYQILKKTAPKNSLLGISFYAFNPLVIIESLVSPHNEVAMLFFLLLAVYQLVVKGNKFFSLINLLLSAGIKYITIVLTPLFIIINKNITFNKKFFGWSLLLLVPPLLTQFLYREPYPWYLLPIIGITAILVEMKNLRHFVSGLGMALLIRYAPYLYTGEYTKQIRQTQDLLFFLLLLITSIFVFANMSRRRSGV